MEAAVGVRMRLAVPLAARAFTGRVGCGCAHTWDTRRPSSVHVRADPHYTREALIADARVRFPYYSKQARGTLWSLG